MNFKMLGCAAAFFLQASAFAATPTPPAGITIPPALAGAAAAARAARPATPPATPAAAAAAGAAVAAAVRAALPPHP